MAKTVKMFPVPAALRVALKDSYDRAFIPGTTRRYARGRHGGIDIGKGGRRNDPPVYACHAGTIRLRSFGSAYGLQITIVAGDGTGFFYAHLSKRWVRDGQKVNTGDKIGLMGNTGQTTKPGGYHLHFEKRLVWSDWRSIVNPYRELLAAQRRGVS